MLEKKEGCFKTGLINGVKISTILWLIIILLAIVLT